MIQFYLQRETETDTFADSYPCAKHTEKESETDCYSRGSDALMALIHLIPSIGHTYYMEDNETSVHECFTVYFYAVGDELNIEKSNEWFEGKRKMWTFRTYEGPHTARGMKDLTGQFVEMVEWLDNNGAW